MPSEFSQNKGEKRLENGFVNDTMITTMFIVISFIIPPNWKQRRYLPQKKMNKQNIRVMEYYSELKLNEQLIQATA